jgi:hypothetical protein
MKTALTSPPASSIDRQRTATHPWLEWGVAFFATWFVVGLYLDGWAHIYQNCA